MTAAEEAGMVGEPAAESTCTDEAAGPPQPIWAGTVAIYPTPKGGVVLITVDHEGHEERRDFPPALVKMGMRLAEGGGSLGKLLGRG